jgi:hypothetical protein
MFRIFMSYRREDSSGYAGRLYDGLIAPTGGEAGFAPAQIFKDIDTLKPGFDFRPPIREALSDCHVVLALIGKHWLNATDDVGVRRLDKPNDWVRFELEEALNRQHIPVVPLLVQGARLPSEGELPESLEALASRQVFEMSDTRWHHDLGRLVSFLKDEEKRQEFNAFARGVILEQHPGFFDRPEQES